MNYNTNKKEVVSFKATIAAGETKTFVERVKAAGTVEGLRTRFYTGQEQALQVRPYVKHKGSKIEHLVTYVEGGHEYLSGEDDTDIIPCVINVDYDDELVVKVTNTSGAYDYTLNLLVTVDYYGGGDRVIGGVLGGT